MDKGLKSQFVFDRHLSLSETQDVPGGLATLFANRKPKPPSSSKKAKRQLAKQQAAALSYHVDAARSDVPPQKVPLDRDHAIHKSLVPEPYADSPRYIKAPDVRISQGLASDASNGRYAHGNHPSSTSWRFSDVNSTPVNHHRREEIAEMSEPEVEAETSDVMDISSGSEADIPDEEITEVATEHNFTNGNHGSSDPVTGWAPSYQDLSDNMDLSSGPDANETDDDEEYEPAPALIQSRESEPSTHTSNEAHIDSQAPTLDVTALASQMLKQASTRASSLSSQLSAVVSPTPNPVEVAQAEAKPKKRGRRRKMLKETRVEFADLRPRTTIPQNISMSTLAQQAINAAYSSRLNPFALHIGEYTLLKDHICHLHVTAYLNIRNRILRLWVQQPLVSVTAEEAAGCAISSRWLGLAEVAYEWLVRRGYINFGCVEVPEGVNDVKRTQKVKKLKKRPIVVVGAGMSGLG